MKFFNRYFVVIFCIVMSAHALAARTSTNVIITNGAVNSSPAIATNSTPVKPVITGFSSTGCVSPGSLITVNGRNFGHQKSLSLLAYVNDGFNNGDDVGVTTQRNVALKVTHWQNTKIMAYMPTSRIVEPGSFYPIGIKNTNSNIWLSNIDKKLLICQSRPSGYQVPELTMPDVVVEVVEPPKPTVPLHPDSTPEVSDKPEPVTDDGATITDDTTEGSGNNTQVVLPNRSGSLINRQLPSTPPKISVLPTVDSSGNAIAEPGELLVISSNMDEAKQLATQLRSFGLSAKKRKVLKNLGLVITTYRVPTDIDLQQTAVNIRQAYPKMWTDLNHRYTLQADNRTTQHAKKLINWQKSDNQCGKDLRIGLIDTEVNTEHLALKNQKIISYSVLSPGIKKANKTHATAIATLLIGSSESSAFSGMLPSAELYSASVFRQRANNHTDTTAEWIVSAIDWLLSQNVQVINMSVGGPRNVLVEVALQRTIESGVPVIAAAGNGGSNATAMYPAAQPGVIAVTAVNGEMEIYSEANKGEYIDFAAPGVDIWAGNEKGAGKFVTGTSFSVPFVTAAMANLLNNSDPDKAYLQLQANATDLGDKGKDEQFGWGLLQVSGACL